MYLAIPAICFGLFVLSHTSFADDVASFAKINVSYNSTTNTLEITGLIYKTFSQNYALTVFNPQGQLITVSQIQLSRDNTFSQNISPSNTLWDMAGNYMVKIASGPQVLAEKSFYFPGTPCCTQNSQGVQADLSKTSNTIYSPLKQFKSGISAADVKCKSDFLLVIKSKDNHPACTTPTTALHLLEIRWGHIASPFNTNVDLLNSKISGGTITGYHYDFQSKSLIIKTQTISNGSITVTIPRKVLDAKAGNQDDHFYVLMNGQEINFTETRTTNSTRTLTIPFSMGTSEIEIIANTVWPQVS
jgi:hypothetical protein